MRKQLTPRTILEVIRQLRAKAQEYRRISGGKNPSSRMFDGAAGLIEELETEVERVRRHEQETAEVANQRIEELERGRDRWKRVSDDGARAFTRQVAITGKVEAER